MSGMEIVAAKKPTNGLLGWVSYIQLLIGLLFQGNELVQGRGMPLRKLLHLLTGTVFQLS